VLWEKGKKRGRKRAGRDRKARKADRPARLIREAHLYGHGFQEVDGHIWELIYMDPGAGTQA
jgi:predicted lactoylglutathione lyase